MENSTKNEAIEVTLEEINPRLTLYYVNSGIRTNTFAEDVKLGLTAPKKLLLPKYFYDTKGSELFEQICGTPEYYVTRTEAEILKIHSDEIYSANTGKNVIIELGSGTSVKTRYIINSFISNNRGLTYIPIDVSNIILASSELLIKDYDRLMVKGVRSEYEDGLQVAGSISDKPKMIVFLGSSIGNFDLHDAKELVRKISNIMNHTDSFLVGFDLVKDEVILNAAYDDKAGVTSEFNLNILTRINTELGGEFDISKFQHTAHFNKSESRMEMHLVSLEEQDVCIHSIREKIHFNKGEKIHTENSYKFTDEMINDIAGFTGLKLLNKWKDSKDYFALCLMGKE